MPSHLKHIVETKGPLHSLERFLEVTWRFSRGRTRFKTLLRDFERIFNSRGIRVTFCVTASVFKRHADLVGLLRELGHEVAAHGHFHTRMDRYDANRQSEMIRRTLEEFSRGGIEVSGFRCPYLNFNEDTLKALMGSRFHWTSGRVYSYFDGEILSEKAVSRLKKLYHFSAEPNPVSVPQQLGDLLEIPITAPDDEILYERQRIRKAERIEQAWMRLLDRAYQEGELYHFFFHPERFELLGGSIGRLLDLALCRNPSIWAPTLSELAQWWTERGQVRWEIVQGETVPILKIRAPEQAVMLVKKDTSGADDVCSGYKTADPLSTSENDSAYVGGDQNRTFTLGLSSRVSSQVESFLKHEGFFVSRSGAPDRHSFYLDDDSPLSEGLKRRLLQSIATSPYPLLRLWRWPGGVRSALVVSADICAINLLDFIDRARHF